MNRASLWEKAGRLTDQTLAFTSGISLVSSSQWEALLVVSLTQANEKLHAVEKLLGMHYWDSAVTLTRALFELAVNMAYIAKDRDKRLPQYLRHGGIPTNEQEAEKLQAEINTHPRPEVKDVVPGKAWKPLRDMCCDLGSDWLKEYETFYRYSSVPTHAGAFTLGKTYLRLLDGKPPSDSERSKVLVTALAFHLRMAQIVSRTFTKQVQPERVSELREQCRGLGDGLRAKTRP